MSATAAIVVPSLKVFDGITDSPAFTGRSRIMPATVDRTSVDASPDRRDAPSRTSSRLDTAAAYSSSDRSLAIVAARSSVSLRALLSASSLRALPGRLGVGELDLRRVDVGLGAVERDGVRDDAHLRDEVARVHQVAGLDLERVDDAADPRFDRDLVPRDDGARGDRLLDDVLDRRLHGVVHDGRLARLHEQEADRAEEEHDDEDANENRPEPSHAAAYPTSVRSASTVRTCTARRAGRNPATIPASMRTTVARITTAKSTCGRASIA